MEGNKKENKKQSGWLQYKIDNAFAGGTRNQLITLMIIVVLLVVVLGAITGVLFLDGDLKKGMGDVLKHLATPIILSGELGSVSAGYFTYMIFVTLVGIGFYGTFIGIITSSINKKMAELGKGHSKIIEEGHVVVLGFSDSIYTIIEEMKKSNENWTGNKKILIVDDKDKGKMEDSFKDRKNLIFRSGNPISENTLNMVSVEKARTIIINEPDDFEVIRVLLALTTYLKRCDAYLNEKMPVITVLMHDRDCISSAKIAAGIHHDFDDDEINPYEENIKILYVDGILAHLFAQACRQPGLSWVISEVCDYSGSEFYIEDKLADGKSVDETFGGKTLGDINQSLGQSIAIGVQRNGKIIINPNPYEFKFEKGDKLIHIAEDDNSMTADFGKASAVIGEQATAQRKAGDDRFNFLVLGWSNPMPKILSEIDLYSSKGSKVTLYTESPRAAVDKFNNINVAIEKRNPYQWSPIMDYLEANLVNCTDESKKLTNIIIISDDTLDQNEADRKSTMMLLNIREYLKDKKLEGKVTVTTEMTQPQDQYLLAQANSNDFIVGSEIANRMLVQVANNPKLHKVFSELLSDEGSEFYLRPFDEYVDTTKPFNFNYIQRAAADKVKLGADKQEIVIGWMRIGNKQANTIIKLNPTGAEKNEVFKPLFGNDKYDSYKLIVVAMD